MSIIRSIARSMLALNFIAAGLDQLRHPDDTAEQLDLLLDKASTTLPSSMDQKLLARTLGGVQIGAGVLLALGKLPRLAAFILFAISTLNSCVAFRSANTRTTQERTARRNHLLKNISLSGGALLASMDTAGRPSLMWRAQHVTAKKNTHEINTGR